MKLTVKNFSKPLAFMKNRIKLSTLRKLSLRAIVSFSRQNDKDGKKQKAK